MSRIRHRHYLFAVSAALIAVGAGTLLIATPSQPAGGENTTTGEPPHGPCEQPGTYPARVNVTSIQSTNNSITFTIENTGNYDFNQLIVEGYHKKKETAEMVLNRSLGKLAVKQQRSYQFNTGKYIHAIVIGSECTYAITDIIWTTQYKVPGR